MLKKQNINRKNNKNSKGGKSLPSVSTSSIPTNYQTHKDKYKQRTESKLTFKSKFNQKKGHKDSISQVSDFNSIAVIEKKVSSASAAKNINNRDSCIDMSQLSSSAKKRLKSKLRKQNYLEKSNNNNNSNNNNKNLLRPHNDNDRKKEFTRMEKNTSTDKTEKTLTNSRGQKRRRSTDSETTEEEQKVEVIMNEGDYNYKQKKQRQSLQGSESRTTTSLNRENNKVKKSNLPSLFDTGSSNQYTTIQQKMKAKLQGAQFRMINETLYTQAGEASFDQFQEDPSLFKVYHTGYREQVQSWPVNPLDIIISWIMKTTKESAEDLSPIKQKQQQQQPQKQHQQQKSYFYPSSSAVIADFGCGEGRLGASIPHCTHSFDLVAANNTITACNIAHVPLSDASVDVVVFCLSLMGSNMLDFIREACRVLKVGGLIKIAEVRSRFEGMTTEQTLKGSSSQEDVDSSTGFPQAEGEEEEESKSIQNNHNHHRPNKNGLTLFVDILEKYAGLKCQQLENNSNKMFVMMQFIKKKDIVIPSHIKFSAKACVYKRR